MTLICSRRNLMVLLGCCSAEEQWPSRLDQGAACASWVQPESHQACPGHLVPGPPGCDAGVVCLASALRAGHEASMLQQSASLLLCVQVMRCAGYEAPVLQQAALLLLCIMRCAGHEAPILQLSWPWASMSALHTCHLTFTSWQMTCTLRLPGHLVPGVGAKELPAATGGRHHFHCARPA